MMRIMKIGRLMHVNYFSMIVMEKDILHYSNWCFPRIFVARHWSWYLVTYWCDSFVVALWHYLQWCPKHYFGARHYYFNSLELLTWHIFGQQNFWTLYLEQEFFNVHMANFADTSSYYQHFKSLANRAPWFLVISYFSN